MKKKGFAGAAAALVLGGLALSLTAKPPAPKPCKGWRCGSQGIPAIRRLQDGGLEPVDRWTR